MTSNQEKTGKLETAGSTPATALRGFPYYQKRPLMVMLSFLAFVVVRYIQLGARRDILATVRFEFLLGIIVIILVSVQFSNRPPSLDDSKPIVLMIGLLFLAMIMQIPFAAAPVVAQNIFMDRVIKFAFLTYFMLVMIETPQAMRIFMIAYLFSIFYITLEATEGQISGGLVWENQGVMRLHGAVPIYEHPNSLAGAAMGSLPFIAFLFGPVKNWWLRLAFLAAVGTSMVCVVFSGSRTAYIGLIALILWWWFQSSHKWRFLFFLLIFGTVFLSVVPDQYKERFKSITGEEKEGHSRDARMEILADAITIFAENPLGVGVASFPAARAARFGRIQDTHNLYLEVATNLGIQGLVVFLGLVGVVLTSLRRSMLAFRRQRSALTRLAKAGGLPPAYRRRIRRHSDDLAYLDGVAKAAGGFILMRLVLGFFGMDLYEVYWWFGSGLAIVLAGLSRKTSRNTSSLIDSVNARRSSA